MFATINMKHLCKSYLARSIIALGWPAAPICEAIRLPQRKLCSAGQMLESTYVRQVAHFIKLLGSPWQASWMGAYPSAHGHCRQRTDKCCIFMLLKQKPDKPHRIPSHAQSRLHCNPRSCLTSYWTMSTGRWSQTSYSRKFECVCVCTSVCLSTTQLTWTLCLVPIEALQCRFWSTFSFSSPCLVA